MNPFFDQFRVRFGEIIKLYITNREQILRACADLIIGIIGFLVVIYAGVFLIFGFPK